MTRKIENKIEQFLRYVEQENSTVENSIEQFKNIFKGNYFVDTNEINEAYYEYKNERYYILNSNGIDLEIVSGRGDIFGNAHSHEGIDIKICSKLSKKEHANEGILLFFESEKEKIDIEEIKNDLLDVDLSEEKILENNDNNIYKTLDLDFVSKDILNSRKVINRRYNQLKEQAIKTHEEQVTYENISPYGGLDVEIIPVEKLLYDSINKFKQDEDFIEKAMTLFYIDYPNFIDKAINSCSHALYIIENKDKYFKSFELEAQKYKIKEQLNILSKDFKVILGNDSNKIIQFLENEKNTARDEIKTNTTRLNQLYQEARLLFNKRYSIFEIFSKQKRIDEKRISELGYKVEDNTEIIYVEGEIGKCDFYIQEKQELIEKLENAIETVKQYDDIYSKIKGLDLKYPFCNFTIWDEIYEDYNYNPKIDNGPYASLNELLGKEEYYINKKQELNEMKQIIQEDSETTINEIDDTCNNEIIDNYEEAEEAEEL